MTIIVIGKILPNACQITAKQKILSRHTETTTVTKRKDSLGGTNLTTLHHGFNMSPKARERKVRALQRFEQTQKHWEHERSITKDKSRIKYCEKKLEKLRITVDNTKSNLK